MWTYLDLIIFMHRQILLRTCSVILFGIASLYNQAIASAVTVDDVDGLIAAISNANGGGDPTILLSDGTYHLNGRYLPITADGVTVRSVGGRRNAVILDGDYETTEIFQVVASNVTIADLTIKRAMYHPIHIMATGGENVTGSLIENVHIIDPGQQAIKINPDSGRTHTVDDGNIIGSLIELTEDGRTKVWEINGSCYTGGIDAHAATGWKIQDNLIMGFWCSGGLSEHGIHFWSNSRNTLVERNQIIDCDRGIGFGLGSRGHNGGIIRNNMIYQGSGHGYSDVGIGMESAPGAKVYNNTIFLEHDYPNSIEYRFTSTTAVSIVNNLTNRAIEARDGASADLSHNRTHAQPGWFTDINTGNLHLAGRINTVSDAGAVIAGLTDDFDKDSRPQGAGIDIGADEYTTDAPGPSQTNTISGGHGQIITALT